MECTSSVRLYTVIGARHVYRALRYNSSTSLRRGLGLYFAPSPSGKTCPPRMVMIFLGKRASLSIPAVTTYPSPCNHDGATATEHKTSYLDRHPGALGTMAQHSRRCRRDNRDHDHRNYNGHHRRRREGDRSAGTGVQWRRRRHKLDTIRAVRCGGREGRIYDL